MSIESKAAAAVSREIARRTSTSIFTPDGQLTHAAHSMPSDGEIKMGEYLDLSMIPFAPAPDGSDHCTNLARLAEYIATVDPPHGGLGPLERQDQFILNAVSMLYCVGKGTMRNGDLVDVKGSSLATPYGEAGYELRSANFAEKFFRNSGALGTMWAKQDVWQQVCHLIAKHNDERAIKEDVRLKCFADARRMELARLDPKSGPGATATRELLKVEWAKEKFHTGWAADRANLRAWMIARGWK